MTSWMDQAMSALALLILVLLLGGPTWATETDAVRFSGRVHGLDQGNQKGGMRFSARFDASELPETDFRENATLTLEAVLLPEAGEELVVSSDATLFDEPLLASRKATAKRAHFRSSNRGGTRVRASVHRRGNDLTLKFRIGRATIESGDLCEQDGDFVLLQTSARLTWEGSEGGEESSLLTLQPWVCHAQPNGSWRLHANGHRGRIYNRPPSARLSVTNLSTLARSGGSTSTSDTTSMIRLDGSDSHDPDGNIAAYKFRVVHVVSGNDMPGLAEAADAIAHVYLPPGNYDVHLTTTDDGGKTDSAVQGIAVAGEAAADPSGDATAWGRGGHWALGDKVVLVRPGECPGGGEPNASGECALLVATRALKPGEIRLRTVNYNVFGRWSGLTGKEGQLQRLRAIPKAIKSHPKMGPDVDVITIAEAWCPDPDGSTTNRVVCASDASRYALKLAFYAAGWKYSSDILWHPGNATKLISGGVIVFSKWPLKAHNQYSYTHCASDSKDCAAAKGAEYVKIIKTDPVTKVKQSFNIFGTHLQAWPTPPGITARAGQLHELHDTYLPALRIPETGSEVVIFQGDMNTDFVLYPEEVTTMKTILHAELPPWVGDQLFSSDPSTNFLVGKDGAAEPDKHNCETPYRHSLNTGHAVPAEPPDACTSVPTHTKSNQAFNSRFLDHEGHLNVGANCKAYCPCCPHETLDYILYSTDPGHLQPLASSIEIVPLKAAKPLTYRWGWSTASHSPGAIAEALVEGPRAPRPTTSVTGSDLSDHYPVVANFIFKPSATEFAPYDGCKQDSSCKTGSLLIDGTNPLTCYCWGDGCTLDGRSRDGRRDGYDSIINANCQHRESTASDQGPCFCRPGDE